MRWTLAALAAAVALAAPSVSSAMPPPDPHDPCASAGRDRCATTGVGFYATYGYGRRWFGDYRRAIPGKQHLFCLDLRFWYASRSYRYRPASAAGLRNRNGEAVPLQSSRKLAYAVWRFGRSDNANRQAAVMLFVHSMMGDARPGEVDPTALNPTVAAFYRRIAHAADSYHGPYRIEVRLPAKLTVGRQATATIRVLSEPGRPVPHVPLTLTATGASGLPARVLTDAAGTAEATLTPTAMAGLRVQATAASLASPQPRVYAPTSAAARANGQRLVLPASKTVTANVSRTDVGASPQISGQVSTQLTTPGSQVTNAVAVTGLGGSSAPVHVDLFGPFSSRDEISCSGTPYWSGSFVANGDTTATTAPARLERAGYYTYRESLAAAPRRSGAMTACGESAQTTFAKGQPNLLTVVANQVVRPGSSVSDRIRVEGLGKTAATIGIELFGPFPSRSAIRCTQDRLHWSGQISVPGNGEFRSPLVKVAHAGFYGYREQVAASPLVAGVTTACAPLAETALAAPRIVTGRGDVATPVAVADTARRGPTRIRVASLGIDARVLAAGIDVRHGVLGVSGDIHRTSWWRDGMAPGTRTGAILIAGHKDSAHAGAGVFFRLGRVRAGERIDLSTAAGRSFGYRVVSVRKYRKSALPTSVFSRTGRARLVLVTCGGRFDEKTGHYPDDVVVTALPLR